MSAGLSRLSGSPANLWERISCHAEGLWSATIGGFNRHYFLPTGEATLGSRIFLPRLCAPLSAWLIGSAILSGCATLDAKVAIPVSCIKDAPAMPQTASEAEILAMDEFRATITIWSERLELRAYAAKASAVIEACK